MSNRKSPGKDNRIVSPPASEREAVLYAGMLDTYIKKHKGEYLRAEDGSLHVILEKQRVPLHDRNHWRLASLMLDACHVSTLTQGAQAAIQRLQVSAQRNAGDLTYSRFSALSQDRARLYVPIAGGDSLVITANNVEHCSNGNGPDRFWVEHPDGRPFAYSNTDGRNGLSLFERLLVNTQACAIPSMRWLVAMHEGFFPFVRSVCTARFLLVHLGGTQQGKTSGAQRFTLLHGLGEVKGDCSVAALANFGDIGLLVLDNKEQANFDQSLIDFCLFLSTGAERARSQTDGQIRRNSLRPVGVITSIEGVWKPELQARCVEVRYQVAGNRTDREDTEENIREQRNELFAEMVPVFQTWLRNRKDGSRHWWEVCPLQNFDRHLSVLAELLRAYGEVAGKPEGWASHIVAEWCEQLQRNRAEDEDALEHPIKTILDNCTDGPIADFEILRGISVGGNVGTLYVTEAGTMLRRLEQNARRDEALPKNSSGLTRRLRSARFSRFRFLDCDSTPQLKRTAKRRPIGFFVPDDEVTAE